jgi:flavodoxin
MITMLILYAPESPALKKCAESLRKAFDRKIFKVTASSAAKSHLSDIAGVKAVILGSWAEDGSPVHTDFAEFIRAFSGVNLSGRCAAFFGEKGSDTAADFTAALADSGISIFKEALVLQEKGCDTQKMKQWAGQYSSYIRKNLHD